jgi:hydroxymethylbilane synthase
MHDVSLALPPAPTRLPPLKAGTRASPLALHQTRVFLDRLRRACPLLRQIQPFEELALSTAGDRILDRRLADLGGKGLFAKEIHEALLDRRVDFAVHSLKDLETELPAGLVLACCLPREDARDALVLGPDCGAPDPADPFAAIPRGAVVGTASLRRQAQLLHHRPDLRIRMIRGNVQSRLRQLAAGEVAATLLALAGLRRLGLEAAASVVLEPEVMVPAAGQGIIGVTLRREDAELGVLLAMIEDAPAHRVATAERALLAALDGSCRTPIGSHAVLEEDGTLRLTGLLARADGGFLLKRSLRGAPGDAARMGRELGAWLRAEAPADILA